ALQARFAGLLYAVGIEVVELLAAERTRLPVAEVEAGRRLTAGQGDGVGAQALGPAGLQHLANCVRARLDAREAVVAGRIGECGWLPGIEAAVVVGVELAGPALQARFAGLLYAVGIEVVELLAAQRAELIVAEVQAGH